MSNLAWKQIFPLTFIIFLLFAGCGEKHPPVDELLVQAETMLDSGQIGNAILVLERCQEISPDRVDVLEHLAFAHAANGDPMMAALTFSRIVEIVPGRHEYRLYAAESLLEANDTTGAISQYELYLLDQPQDRAIHVTLSNLQESVGNISRALDSMLAAEQVESRATQQIDIGRLYLRSENLAQAQVWFATAIGGGSEVRDEAMLGLLETAVRSGRFQDAESILKQLDAEYPGRLEQSEIDNVRDQLAEWRRRQDEAMEAVAALEKPAVEAPPVAEEPLPEESVEEGANPSIAEEVIAEQITSQPEEAPVEEDPVAVIEPEPPVIDDQPSPLEIAEASLEEARRLRAEGELDEAIYAYKQALVRFDNQPMIWAELSETYLEAGNGRWAQATASEAMRRDPDNAKLVLQFLRASQETMEGPRLIREMEDAYRKFPNHLEIILVLARAYQDMGNQRNANILYGKFLELAPVGHPERASVLREFGNP